MNGPFGEDKEALTQTTSEADYERQSKNHKIGCFERSGLVSRLRGEREMGDLPRPLASLGSLTWQTMDRKQSALGMRGKEKRQQGEGMLAEGIHNKTFFYTFAFSLDNPAKSMQLNLLEFITWILFCMYDWMIGNRIDNYSSGAVLKFELDKNRCPYENYGRKRGRKGFLYIYSRGLTQAENA
ncbi:MAG: hypothetical protein HFE39_01760 [Clostridiales bacterium]|nr:hypothetical protein [Clostridiales bacterium]